MDEIFVIRKTSKKDVYEIAKFGDAKRVVDQKDSQSVFNVKITNKVKYCDCPGFRWHRNKPMEHKHIRLVNFWLENLEAEIGYALWFDKKDNIEFNKFLDMDYIYEKYYT